MKPSSVSYQHCLADGFALRYFFDASGQFQFERSRGVPEIGPMTFPDEEACARHWVPLIRAGLHPQVQRDLREDVGPEKEFSNVIG